MSDDTVNRDDYDFDPFEVFGLFEEICPEVFPAGWPKTGRKRKRGKKDKRVSDALKRLADRGFKVDSSLEIPYDDIAGSFNSRTLWQVFGLAQILKTEQPLPCFDSRGHKWDSDRH